MAEVYIPAHKVTFHLTHNQHLSYYETVEQMLESMADCYGFESFISPQDRQECIDTNEIWEAQWYPETPVGFNKLCASSLDVLNAALANMESTIDWFDGTLSKAGCGDVVRMERGEAD